jgi:hypothetical protein
MGTLTENVDKNENMKAIVVQKCITFFQSAKNPQKNELTTTPVEKGMKIFDITCLGQ